MNLVTTNLSTIAAILGVMAAISVVELVLPLRRRDARHRAHLGPNLGLTFLTFAITFVLNTGVVLFLIWLEARGAGLLRWLPVGPIAAAVVGIVLLDLTWYGLHVAMHRVPVLWRIHRVHHSDPEVDVTTTIRQHPSEGLLRYASITACAGLLGVGVGAYAAYRAWSALNGLVEHANVRIPRWLDKVWSSVSVSPYMHRVHHSRDVRETDSNYGNIFSFFDRAFGTFTPTERGPAVRCGLDGHEAPEQQTLAGLLVMPFADRVPSEAARASS